MLNSFQHLCQPFQRDPELIPGHPELDPGPGLKIQDDGRVRKMTTWDGEGF